MEDIASVKLLSPKPGDVVVVTVKGRPPLDQIVRIRDHIKREFPNQSVLIVDENSIEIEIKEEILGYYADGRPIHPPKRGSLVTQACILCRSCKEVISTCGGPGLMSICIDCYKKENKLS